MYARTLDHVAVTVSDLNRSLAFYRDALGLVEVERHTLEGAGIETMTAKPHTVLQVVRLQAPDSPKVLIDLQQYIAPPSPTSQSNLGDVANAHFCLGVRDLEEVFRRLRDGGTHFYSDPVALGLEDGVVRVVFLQDPDGFVLELVEVDT